MMRRKHSLSLHRSNAVVEEDVNPNSYITNLADCMLVMTVGLLVALVTHYGVDLQQSDEPMIGHEVEMDADGDGKVDDGFEQTGRVYRDSETGKYYMVEG
jgi:hypothetical protein